MSKTPINNKILKLDSLKEQLEANGLTFLTKEIDAITSYDYKLFKSTSIDLDSFRLDLIFPDLKEETIQQKVIDLVEKTKLSDLIEDISKKTKQLESIANRKIKESLDLNPFALKISRTFDNAKESKNRIDEIAFSTYKTAIPTRQLNQAKKEALKLIKAKHSNDLSQELKKEGIKVKKFDDVLFPAYITLYLENYVLDEVSPFVSPESLEFLRKNYTTVAKEENKNSKPTTATKKTSQTKNTKSKNPFLNAYVFTCGLKGKFLGVDFEVSGKLEEKKLSFATELIFGKQEQNALKIDELKSNFSFDFTDVPQAENFKENKTEVKIGLYYSNNSFYAVVQYSTSQLHLGFGEKNFLITQFDLAKQKDADYSILKTEFGLKKVFLLIQQPGALSNNHHLLTEFKEQFNIKNEDSDEPSEASSETVKVESVPFEKTSAINLNEAKFVLGAQIKNNLADESDKGLVPSIMDFIGAEQIDFYGVYKSKQEKELFLYIDKLGNPDRFFSVSDLKIKWFKKTDNTGFEGGANLTFNFNNDKDPFTIIAKAGFSTKSMYFGGEVNKPIKLSDRLTIKKAAATIGYSKKNINPITFGIAGMIEGKCIDNSKIFNLQGATSFSVLGSTVKPTLISAAVTSTGESVVLADFVYSVTGLNLSFVPMLGLLKIEDIELTKSGVKIEKDLPNSTKTSFNSNLPFKDFSISDDYTIQKIGSSSNYLVTDKVKMINYKVTNKGGINLVSQVYICTEQSTIGATTYNPGVFIAGQLGFLGQKARFLFKVGENEAKNKTFTAALTIDPINILGGLASIKYFDTKKSNTIEGPGLINLFNDKNKELSKRGPVLFCDYQGSLQTLQMVMSADISFFWGLMRHQADFRIANNQIEARVNMKFAIFNASIIFKANIEDFAKGQFYLKMDLEVESINKKLKEAADNVSRKTKEISDKLRNAQNQLTSKSNEENKLRNEIASIQRQINNLSWTKFLKIAALKIEKGLKTGKLIIITFARKALEVALDALIAVNNLTGKVVAGVIKAVAWVVEQIGNILSLDSLCLEIDTRKNSNVSNSKKILFNAEADYTILGKKRNSQLNLNIDFSKESSILSQIVDQITTDGNKFVDTSSSTTQLKAMSVTNSMATNIAYKTYSLNLLSEDLYIAPEQIEEVKEITIVDDILPIKEEQVDVKSLEIQTNEYIPLVHKRNVAIEKLYTLLVQNEFAINYLNETPDDLDDVVYWEMKKMSEEIVNFSKDNFIDELGNRFTSKKFNTEITEISTAINKEKETEEILNAKEKIAVMVNHFNEFKDVYVDSKNEFYEDAKVTLKDEEIDSIKTVKQLRRVFIKYFNDFMLEVDDKFITDYKLS